MVKESDHPLPHQSVLKVIQMKQKKLGVLVSLVSREGEPIDSGLPVLLHLLAQEKQFAQTILGLLVPLFCRGVQPADSPIYVFLCKELFPKAILCEGISPLR